LEEASGGSIALDGTDITDTPPAKRDLAMVFQTYALYPHMTVRRNLSFALDLVVGHVDHGRRQFLVQPRQFQAHLHAQGGVEVGQRFVEEEYLRV
ncbi:ABC transporter ATP-binding protein, partial [Pseudomonas aeruginosa]